MFAEVILDVAHSDVDKIFDYSCQETLLPGTRVRVPFGGSEKIGFVVRCKETSLLPPEKIKPILSFDEAPLLNAEALSLAEELVLRYRCPKALALRLFLPSEMRRGTVDRAYVTIVRLKEGDFKIDSRAKQQRALFEYLKEHEEAPAPFLRKTFQGGFDGLKKKGALVFEERRVFRGPYREPFEPYKEKQLTDAQKEALERIRASEKPVSLLFGVTGSGKTEIYLELINEQLEKGKSALFLVPEIALTPQMLKKLRARFQEKAAILHSGLSSGERYDEWMRLKEGEAKIAIGARSAVFAPLEKIGIIILDEEHDGSYDSENAPRYQTFDIALLRARYHGAKLILGSATPSVETYKRALEGEFELVRLKERYHKRPMPKISIVDMRLEAKRGNPSPFSGELKEKLANCLKENSQAIFFLNRRGYAPTIVCRNCGYVFQCEQCDVSLTYHRDEKRGYLKCHYCGRSYQMSESCPVCNSRHLGFSGLGTQKVVSELQFLFPKAKILRLDLDAGGKERRFEILNAFSEHRADILVGTQMIAKGHDFPNVTLVGIVDADMSLHFPDYRSGERTFQLVTQAAGRCGRGERAGEVVLQSYDPENPVLRFAADYDFEGFYAREISMREGTAFPPFAKIVRVMVVSKSNESALEALKEVYSALEKIKGKDPSKFLFLNRMHSPVKKIQNKYRYQALMRLTCDEPLKEIYEAVSNCKQKDTLVYAEENPANLS